MVQETFVYTFNFRYNHNYLRYMLYWYKWSTSHYDFLLMQSSDNATFCLTSNTYWMSFSKMFRHFCSSHLKTAFPRPLCPWRNIYIMNLFNIPHQFLMQVVIFWTIYKEMELQFYFQLGAYFTKPFLLPNFLPISCFRHGSLIFICLGGVILID